MEWLKDKKNLPIVAALLVFIALAAGGFTAYTMGVFPSGQSAQALPPAPAGIPSGPPVGPSGPPNGVGGPQPLEVRPNLRRGQPGLPQGQTVPPAGESVAVIKKPVSTNPLVGPDPFKIPGGAQKLAKSITNAIPKPALRDEIGPLNLFTIRPPAPPVPPTLPSSDATGANAAANYRLSGVITGADGINAIVEVGGQSQSVKPGDALPDGTQVQNIQTNSITLRTAQGAVFNLPLSAGTPDQGQNFNGPPGFNGGFNGRQQFNPGGFNPGGFNPGGFNQGGQEYIPTGQGQGRDN